MRVAAVVPLLLAAAAAAAEPVAGEAMAVEANSAFAVDLYRNLSTKPGNVFFSPVSISTALAMTWTGARGKTADEMRQVLHFEGAPSPIRLAAEPKAPYELAVANRLFAEKSFPFLPPFLSLLKDRYSAPVELLDFRNASDASRVHVNRWVEKQTKEKIKDLFPPGSITGDARLVLANAIYFKGSWVHQFDKGETRQEPFQAAGKKLDVPMMSQTTHVAYDERDGLQILELPYKGPADSGGPVMMLLLPKDKDGIAALEAKLTTKALNGWARGLKTQKVLVQLPRFKIETSYGLNEPLAALGMKTAFDCSELTTADFSGMDGKRDLCLSAAVHKAYVEVNETGTEAAAATGIAMSEITSVEMPPPVFRADHPFIFAIRDGRSGALLFLGRLSEPR